MKKKLTCFALLIVLTFGLLLETPVTVQAAGQFVFDTSEMIGQGGYIYFIRRSQNDSKAVICRKKVSGGKVSVVTSEPNGVLRLIASGQYLYYTSYDDEGNWVIRMCRLNGEDVHTICEGVVCYADADRLYGIRMTGADRQQLFCMEYETEEITAIKTAASGQTLDYIENIGDDSYYYIYDKKQDKVYLFRMNTTTNQIRRIAVDKRMANDSMNPLYISDVALTGGELYYDFGSTEGTGNFWYGTIRKLAADGKKKTVAKNTDSKQLVMGSKELYYVTSKGDYYKYQLSTGKKSKYSLRFEKNVSYTILGDKTYLADTTDKQEIKISRFKSGTDRETLTKNFITIPFKQKKNVNYAVSMKQAGIYNLVCVTGTDFTDQSYGWRGKLVSINWYITDGAGTVLGSFK